MIDDHVHLWDRGLVEGSEAALAALKYFRREIQAVPADLQGLVKELKEAGVRKAFLLAMDCSESSLEPLRKVTVRNEAIAKAVEMYPDLFIGFGSVDPRKAKAVEEVERAVNRLGLRGLKFHASAVEVRPDDRDRMFPLYSAAQDLGIPIIHHTGTTALGNCLIHYARPVYFDAVAQAFPDLPIMLAHFGWPWMEECFAVLMRNPSLYTDISGWLPRYLPDGLVNMINGPLRERTLVGSDYPMLKPDAWLEDFRKSLEPRLKVDIVPKLLEGNAVKFLER